MCCIFVKFLRNLSHLRFPRFPTILLDFRPIFPVLRATLSISKPFNEFPKNLSTFKEICYISVKCLGNLSNLREISQISQKFVAFLLTISAKFVKSARNFSNFPEIRCIFVEILGNFPNFRKIATFLLNFWEIYQIPTISGPSGAGLEPSWKHFWNPGTSETAPFSGSGGARPQN